MENTITIAMIMRWRWGWGAGMENTIMIAIDITPSPSPSPSHSFCACTRSRNLVKQLVEFAVTLQSRCSTPLPLPQCASMYGTQAHTLQHALMSQHQDILPLVLVRMGMEMRMGMGNEMEMEFNPCLFCCSKCIRRLEKSQVFVLPD